MRNVSLFIFWTLLTGHVGALSAAVRCEEVFGEPKALTGAEQRLFNDYWNAQWYLYKRMGGLFDANPDPRITRLEVGLYTDLVTESNPRMRSVSIDEMKKTQSQWQDLLRAEAYEEQNLVLQFDDLFLNPYTKQIVGIESRTPMDAPLARLIPAELKSRYPKLFMSRHRFQGADKSEQSVDAAVHLAFSALRSLLVRKESQDAISPADQKILSKIFFDGSSMRPIQFASEGEINFSPDPASPHRLAVTGDEANSPMIFNRERLKELVESKKMTLADLAGLIVHELAHHQGLKDDEKRTPDRMGALVTKMILDGSQTRDLDPDGRTRLHLYKWGYRPTVFRHSNDGDTFSIILEDRGTLYNLTSYVKQILKQGDARERNSLFTLRDFDVDVIRTPSAQGTSFELRLNFHLERSIFDLERYKRETGVDPAALEKATPEKQKAWYDGGRFANPKYQIKRPSEFADADLVFNADSTGKVKLNSVLVIPRFTAPAELSAASSRLMDLKILKTEGRKIFGSVLLKDFDLPDGYTLNLIAKLKDLEDLPMLGPVNRIPLRVGKSTKSSDGLLLEFTYDDSIGLSSRELSIDAVNVIGQGFSSMLPTATSVDFKLPPRVLRPPLSVTAFEIHRDEHELQKLGFAFQVEGLTHLQEAKLFVEVTTLNDLTHFERHLMQIDLMMLNDPRARDAWAHEWVGKFEGRVLNDHQHVFRVGIDPTAFGRNVQSVRLHSLFVKDVDLRRQFLLIPDQPFVFRQP